MLGMLTEMVLAIQQTENDFKTNAYHLHSAAYRNGTGQLKETRE